MIRLVYCLLLLIGLSGCQVLKSDITKVDLRLIAKADINPDDNGRPSPLVIRIIELRALQGFSNGDFFALYHDEKQTLGTDLIASEDIELKPGDIRDLKLALHPDTEVLAVLAAYRQLEHANWRLSVPFNVKHHNQLTLLFNAKGIALATHQ